MTPKTANAMESRINCFRELSEKLRDLEAAKKTDFADEKIVYYWLSAKDKSRNMLFSITVRNTADITKALIKSLDLEIAEVKQEMEAL